MKNKYEQPEETDISQSPVHDCDEAGCRIPDDELEARLDAFIDSLPEVPITPEIERIWLRRALLERSYLNGKKSKKK